MKLSVSRVAATESLEASESSPNQVKTPSINFLPLQIFQTSRDARIPLVDPTNPSLGENLAHTEEVQTDGLYEVDDANIPTQKESSVLHLKYFLDFALNIWIFHQTGAYCNIIFDYT